MAVDCSQDVRARGIRAQAELCIQSKEFKRVVMIRAHSSGARSKKADRSATILSLYGSVSQLSSCGNAFGKPASRPGDVESHPVKNVAYFLIHRDIGIMGDQNETDRIRWYVGPLQLG